MTWDLAEILELLETLDILSDIFLTTASAFSREAVKFFTRLNIQCLFHFFEKLSSSCWGDMMWSDVTTWRRFD